MAGRVKEKGKYVAIGGGAIALGIAGYSFFKHREKKALIEEYISETKDLESYYRQAAENGEITPAERKGIEHRTSLLEAKEEVIKSKGLVNDLVRGLASILGIVVAFPITLWVVQKIIKRQKPPPPRCPRCDKPIEDWDNYQDHVRDDHVEVPDESLWEEGIEEVAKAGTILLAMISAATGVAIENLREGWDWFYELPRWQQVVIILAIIAVCLIAAEFVLVASEAEAILAAFGIAVAS